MVETEFIVSDIANLSKKYWMSQDSPPKMLKRSVDNMFKGSGVYTENGKFWYGVCQLRYPNSWFDVKNAGADYQKKSYIA